MRQHTRGWKNGCGGHEVDPRLGSSDCHSYGGAVIMEAVNGSANAMPLVFVNGFVPDTGESALTLAEKFPAVRSAARSPRCRRPGRAALTSIAR